MIYEFRRNKVTIEDCDRIIQQYYFGSISEINNAVYTACQKETVEEATEWFTKWFEYSQLKCDGSCGKYEGFELETFKKITGKALEIRNQIDFNLIFPDFIYDKSTSRSFVKTEDATDLYWIATDETKSARYKQYNATVVPYERGSKSRSITTSTAIHDQVEIAKIKSLHFNELPILYADKDPNALKMKKDTNTNSNIQYLVTKDTAQTISAETVFGKIKILGKTNVFMNTAAEKERIKDLVRACIRTYCQELLKKYGAVSLPIGFDYVATEAPTIFDGEWKQVGIFDYPESTTEEELATRPKIWRRVL